MLSPVAGSLAAKRIGRNCSWNMPGHLSVVVANLIQSSKLNYGTKMNDLKTTFIGLLNELYPNLKLHGVAV